MDEMKDLSQTPQKSEIRQPNQQDRASFSVRFWAFFMDIFMIYVPLRFFHLLVVTFSKAYQPISILLILTDLLLPLIVYWWYFSYYCYKHNGQTLGKKWNKIRVASLDGSYPSLKRLNARTLVQLGLPVILSPYGLLWYITYFLALTKDKRALHDYVVKTQVIKAD